jgi:hypothetical protein
MPTVQGESCWSMVSVERLPGLPAVIVTVNNSGSTMCIYDERL